LWHNKHGLTYFNCFIVKIQTFKMLFQLQNDAQMKYFLRAGDDFDISVSDDGSEHTPHTESEDNDMYASTCSTKIRLDRKKTGWNQSETPG